MIFSSPQQIVEEGIAVLAIANLALLLYILVRRTRAARQRARETQLREIVVPIIARVVAADADVDYTRLAMIRPQSQIVVARLLGEYGVALSGASRQRITAVFEGGGLFGLMVRELRRGRPWRRIRACEILGDVGTVAAIEHLERAMLDHNADVRAAAARALGRIADPRCAPPLVAAFTGVGVLGNSVPAVTSFHALIELGEAGMPAFLRAIESPDPLVRLLSCHGLAHSSSDAGYVFDVAPLLARTAAIDADPFVRAAAITAIGRLGDERARDAAIGAANDADVRVRRAAMRALALLPSPDVIAELVDATDDVDRETALRAADALCKLMEDPAYKDYVYGALTGHVNSSSLAIAMKHRSVAAS